MALCQRGQDAAEGKETHLTKRHTGELVGEGSRWAEGRRAGGRVGRRAGGW